MAGYALFLRGVNVGGRNKVPMAQLRDVLSVDGFSDVRTYVQSGNVIVTSSLRSPSKVSDAVRTAIAREFNVDTPVVVRTPAELRAVMDWNPFPDVAAVAPQRVHIVHLTDTPSTDAVDALLTTDWEPEQIAFRATELAICYSESMHTSKLQYAGVLKRLGVDGTARNWRTVQTLADMSGSA